MTSWILLEILLALAVLRSRIPVMTKRALFAVAGFLILCHPLSAQQTQRPEQPYFDGSRLDRSQLPWLTLENQERFFFSTAFGYMQPTTNYLPAFSPVEPQRFASPTLPSRRNSSDNGVELRPADRIYTGGEFGVLYGKSSGKYGREDFQSYIIGTVGNEKFSITAGAAYERSTGRVPYWYRR